MKHTLFILTTTLISLLSCSQTTNKTGNQPTGVGSINYISQSDAEKILGQAATLTESSVEENGNALKSRYTYTATSKEATTGKTGHLYFMFEKYNDEASAKKTFAGIISQNQNMPNIKKLSMGDEALRHTDNENFDMIIVRKGNKIIRLKVNKLTSMTSTKDLLITAEKITTRTAAHTRISSIFYRTIVTWPTSLCQRPMKWMGSSSHHVTIW